MYNKKKWDEFLRKDLEDKEFDTLFTLQRLTHVNIEPASKGDCNNINEERPT